MIDDRLDEYLVAETKPQKAAVVTAIVQQIRRSGGRFLHRDEKTGDWCEISRSQVRHKVGHALRDAKQKRSRRLRTEQEQKEQDDFGTPLADLILMQRAIFEDYVRQEEEEEKRGNEEEFISG